MSYENTAANLHPNVSRPYEFGRIHLTPVAAASLVAQLRLVKECINQDRPGVAAEILSEAKARYSTSPSLLIKIMLSDLCDLFTKNPRDKIGQQRSVRDLETKLLKQLRQSEQPSLEWRGQHLH